MSEPDWRAVLADDAQITVWAVKGQSFGAAEKMGRSNLADLSGPLLVAGLDITPRPVPARPLSDTTHAPGLPHVAAIPMLRQETPAALSRGAETAIAGYISSNSGYDGVLLVLGEEETLWAHISAEEVVSFQTFLTPLLTRHLGATYALDDMFEAALADSLSRPERLAQHLASARAIGSGQQAAHLIGAEIAAAKPYWLGQQVTILADGNTAAPYQRALTAQGVSAETSGRTEALLHGFAEAWATLTT